MIRSKRLKPVSLLAGLGVSAVTLLSWTMPWFVVVLDDAEVERAAINIPGDVAAPALSALGLAGCALVAALAIAGPLFRLVLGALEAAIGLCVFWSAASAITDPVSAASLLVTKATGVSGADSVATLVESTTQTGWPPITLVIGVLTIIIGVFIAVTGRSWPSSSRKYQTVKFQHEDGTRTSVSDWDSLSDGSDPTSR